MWRTVPGVGSMREEGRAAVPPSPCAPCAPCPGGERVTHTALLRLPESASLLTIYPKKILFEANPLGASVCFASGVGREQTAGG